MFLAGVSRFGVNIFYEPNLRTQNAVFLCMSQATYYTKLPFWLAVEIWRYAIK